MVEPQEWETFLYAFTRRNHGRRARFEIFGPKGGFKEEEQEGNFASISLEKNKITVTRHYEKNGGQQAMVDELINVRGISVQYDTDKSVNVLEFADDKGGKTMLHFESKVDGVS
jgi:hypothetical protein